MRFPALLIWLVRPAQPAGQLAYDPLLPWGVLTVCMLLIGAAYLLGVNIDAMVEYIGDQNETVVYMDQGASDDQIAAADTAIRSTLSTWWASPTCRPRTCWQFTATCCPPTPTCRMLSLMITRSTPTTALWWTALITSRPFPSSCARSMVFTRSTPRWRCPRSLSRCKRSFPYACYGIVLVLAIVQHRGHQQHHQDHRL